MVYYVFFFLVLRKGFIFDWEDFGIFLNLFFCINKRGFLLWVDDRLIDDKFLWVVGFCILLLFIGFRLLLFSGFLMIGNFKFCSVIEEEDDDCIEFKGVSEIIEIFFSEGVLMSDILFFIFKGFFE